MKTPMVVITVIVVGMLGLLVIFSQSGLPEKNTAEPTHQEAGGYGEAPSGGYGAAPSGGYGAAPSGGYGAAPSGGYGAAPSGGYGSGAPAAEYKYWDKTKKEWATGTLPPGM